MVSKDCESTEPCEPKQEPQALHELFQHDRKSCRSHDGNQLQMRGYVAKFSEPGRHEDMIAEPRILPLANSTLRRRKDAFWTSRFCSNMSAGTNMYTRDCHSCCAICPDTVKRTKLPLMKDGMQRKVQPSRKKTSHMLPWGLGSGTRPTLGIPDEAELHGVARLESRKVPDMGRSPSQNAFN